VFRSFAFGLDFGLLGFGACPKKRAWDSSHQAKNRRDLSARFDGIVARDLSSVATIPMLASTLSLPIKQTEKLNCQTSRIKK